MAAVAVALGEHDAGRADGGRGVAGVQRVVAAGAHLAAGQRALGGARAARDRRVVDGGTAAAAHLFETWIGLGDNLMHSLTCNIV